MSDLFSGGATSSPGATGGAMMASPSVTSGYFGVASSLTQSLLGGGQQAQPQVGGSATSTAATNVSGADWTVATSGSKASGGGLPWYVWVLGGIVAIKFLQKKKGK